MGTSVSLASLFSVSPCEANCARIGDATYYTFSFTLEGKECVALSKYSDGSGIAGITCD